MNLTKAGPRSAGGSLAAVRSTNQKLSLAMSAVPDLDQVSKMIDDLDEGVKQLRPTMTFDVVEVEIRDSLAAGTGVPTDILDRYAQAVAADGAAQAANDRLNLLYGSLVDQRANLIQGGLSTMCAALNDDLQRIYTKLRALLPYPASAKAAITAGRVRQFQAAAALRAEYLDIRAAHRLLLTHGLDRNDGLFNHLSNGWPLIAHASGLGAIWADLPEWNKYGKKLGKLGQIIKLTPPWPSPDSEAFLDWLLEHPDAGPWVPDFDQATELLNQIVSSAHTLYETTRSPDQQALDEEYGRRQRMWRPSAHLIDQ